MSHGGSDRGWLARAIALAETARPLSSPNPAVGCVLVRDERNVGEGATRPAGDDHAEVVALGQASTLARGATAYVTLEPCAHHGRTPPCTDALIAAGVSRVVLASPDPHRKAGGGQRRLREAGIDVQVLGVDDPFRQIVQQQLEGFFTTTVDDRVHVTLKLAQTTAGALTAATRWVTHVPARRAVHRWRASVDGVLVGIGTVLADDPALNVRDVTTPRQPRPVIIDTHLRTPMTAQVMRPGTVIITGDQVDAEGQREAKNRGVEVVAVAQDGPHVSLPAAVRALARLGMTSVLAEPGKRLAQAFLDRDLIDRLVLHVADHGEGTVVVPAVRTPPATTWSFERLGGAGPDLIVHLRRDRDRTRFNPEVAR